MDVLFGTDVLNNGTAPRIHLTEQYIPGEFAYGLFDLCVMKLSQPIDDFDTVAKPIQLGKVVEYPINERLVVSFWNFWIFFF